MLINYLRMKAIKIRLKYKFYLMIEKTVTEKDDILRFIQNLYESLKDIDGKEFQNQLITAVSELVHTQAMKERDIEKNQGK